MCAGGIIGLGEGPKDRVGLIHQLATLPEHPESVPINALVAVAGQYFCFCKSNVIMYSTQNNKATSESKRLT